MSVPSSARLGAALAGLTLCLCACSSGPSVVKVEEHLRNRVEAESEGRLKLASFRKTNAQEGELFGVPAYSLEYEAEIEVLETCFWTPRYFGEISFRTVGPDEMSIYLELQGYQRVREGERVTFTNSFEFEKTERGWKGPGGKIY